MASKAFTFTNVRFLFPSVLRPKPTFAGDGEQYSVVILIPKTDTAQINRFVKFYNDLIKSEFGAKPAGLRPPVGDPLEKAVLKDGDKKYASVDIDKRPNYEPYQGHYYANLSIDALRGKIEAVDIDRQPILSEDQFPNGSYGHIVTECSAYKSPKFGPQFTVRPVLIQVTDTSQPFGPSGMDANTAMNYLPDSTRQEEEEEEEEELPL